MEFTKPAVSTSAFADKIDAGLLAAANLATKSARKRIPTGQHQVAEPQDELITISHTNRREIKKEKCENTTDLMEFPLLDLFESENPSRWYFKMSYVYVMMWNHPDPLIIPVTGT